VFVCLFFCLSIFRPLAERGVGGVPSKWGQMTLGMVAQYHRRGTDDGGEEALLSRATRSNITGAAHAIPVCAAAGRASVDAVADQEEHARPVSV